MTQDGFERINATLDRIEIIMEDMNSKLSRMMDEIDRYNNEIPSDKTVTTTTYDGEIMFRYKQNSKDVN